MAQHGHLTRKQKKEIRIGRKKLRKDLRQKGITSRKEFEKIAQMLGLVYGDDGPWLLGWWWRFWEYLAGLGWRRWMSVLFTTLLVILPFSIIENQKGNFIVTMTDSLMDQNMVFSERESFEVAKVQLRSDELKEVNAYTLADMPDNLDQQEGSHNMANVVAYTFWIRNDGEETTDYDWYLLHTTSTKNVDYATWVMLYEEGKQTIYAREREDGIPEYITGYHTPTLSDQAANPDEQYQPDESGNYRVVTTPYLDRDIVAKGSVENIAPGESRKYTAVIWVEGEDPDCTEDLIGGHSGYAMRFTTKGDKEEIYEKYSYQSDTVQEIRDNNTNSFGNLLNGIRK